MLINEMSDSNTLGWLLIVNIISMVALIVISHTLGWVRYYLKQIAGEEKK